MPASLSLNFCTLFVGVMGNESTNSMYLGTK